MILQYPIIGTEESLNSMTIDDTIEFFNNYYCANNATITIISNLEFEEVKYIALGLHPIL